MKLKMISPVVVLIFLVIAVAKIQCEGEVEVVGDEECKKTILALVEKQLDSLKVCLRQVENKKERAGKMMCIMKCSMIKEGFLEPDGSVNIEGSLGVLNNFSSAIQTRILDYLMKNCNQYVQEIDPTQENCKSYEPMIRCCHDMLNHVCG